LSLAAGGSIPMTLESVAKRARVSASTVSRVLNNLGVVKESTRNGFCAPSRS
jgi:arginine repressor